MSTKIKKLLSILLLISLLFGSLALASAATPPAVDDDYYPCTTYVNGSKVSDVTYTLKGNIYISVDSLKKYGDTSKMTIDTKNSKITLDPASYDMYLGDTETTAYIQKYCGEIYIPLKNFYNNYFVSLGAICQFAGLTYSYNNMNVYIASMTSSQRFGNASALGASAAGSVFGNGKTVYLTSGEIAFVEDESVSYYKIKTLAGETAYVSKSQFTPAPEGTKLFDFTFAKKTKKHFSGLFNLVWFQGAVRTELCPSDQGIDVIAPVWYTIEVSGEGSARNWGDYGYVELAHSYGMEVWATYNNFGSGSSQYRSYTTKLLTTDSLKKRTIAQFLMYACIYNYDGINIDFEGLAKTDRDGFTSFMTELSTYTNKLGLALSVDTLVPASYNTMYDDEALGNVCDYVCVMTYDEHYSKSTTPGSAASKSWVTSWINKLKEYVPEEKIVMGVPLYGLSWVMYPDGSINYMSALTMATQRARITENHQTPVWKDDIGQYYTEYVASDGYGRKMWIEDARSIAMRCQLAKDLGVAGIACWRYDEAEDGIFDVIYKMLKKNASVNDFAKPY